MGGDPLGLQNLQVGAQILSHAASHSRYEIAVQNVHFIPLEPGSLEMRFQIKVQIIPNIKV